MRKKSVSIVLLVCILFSFISIGLIFQTFAVVLPLISLFIVFVVIYFIERKFLNYYLLAALYLISFILLVYFADFKTYGLPYYIGSSDDFHFETTAKTAVSYSLYLPQEIHRELLEEYAVGSGYISFLAIIVSLSESLGGYHTVLPRLLNITFLLLAVILLNKLVKDKNYLNEKYRGIFTIVLLFTPNIAYINSYIFRDMFNLMLVILCTVLIVNILKIKNIPYLAINLPILLFGMFYCYHTRSQSVMFILILLIPFLFTKIIEKKIIFIIFSTLALFVAVKYLNLKYFIEAYSKYIVDNNTGLSSYIFGMDILPFGIFARFIYGLIVPFPNFFNLFNDSSRIYLDFISVLIYLGVVAQIILLPFLLKRLIKLDWVAIIFLGMYMTVIISTFTFRHFVFYYPFLVLLIIKGLEDTKSKQKIIWITIMYLILLSILYLVLKVF